jgi:polyhydroxyalkanoate synthesis regulator phasin
MLLSYQRLRDEITRKTLEDRLRLERGGMSADEMRGLVSELLREREMVVEEVDELREQRYGWISEAQSRRDSMKLMLSELDEKTYNDLESVASRLNVDAGRLLNELMGKAVEKGGDPSTGLPTLSSEDLSHLHTEREDSIDINHVGELVVDRGDLAELRPRVKFSHIGRLEFDATVDEELFHEKVKGISQCRLVRFPEGFSKLLAYVKSSHCDGYEFVAPKDSGQQIHRVS